MISKLDSEALKGRLGFSNSFGVGSRGKAGGLCLFWKEEKVSFNLVSYSQNHICGDVQDGDRVWRFIGIYGWPEGENKHKTWTLMRHLAEGVEIPIVFGGDFNEILGYEEQEGGAGTERKEMGSFREVVDDLGLRDMGYRGSWYTWERGLTPATCKRERLDRVLAVPAWLTLYPNTKVEHLIRYKSDHVAMVVRTQDRRKGKNSREKKGFKFETSWLLDEEIVVCMLSSINVSGIFLEMMYLIM
ncbi:uncharacterized protein [Spinacia oleracea]|uniref:Endonuclease/exonuclease/phosphatase domain-containing protein n=1 Tax=Spinacia oleracea TaxID=3562 RepID=A0A9R0JUJ4_SPIOL|nr:uncharacterized protein LOC110787346 [Spinacia oleracea]